MESGKIGGVRTPKPDIKFDVGNYVGDVAPLRRPGKGK